MGLMGTVPSCAVCEMTVGDGEYHPYAACLMYKQCRNAEAVKDNLWAVVDFGRQLEKEKR